MERIYLCFYNCLLPRCLLSIVLHKVILTFTFADCQKLFLVRKRRAVLGICWPCPGIHDSPAYCNYWTRYSSKLCQTLRQGMTCKATWTCSTRSSIRILTHFNLRSLSLSLLLFLPLLALSLSLYYCSFPSLLSLSLSLSLLLFLPLLTLSLSFLKPSPTVPPQMWMLPFSRLWWRLAWRMKTSWSSLNSL